VSRREDVSTAITQHASNAFGHARHARTSCYRADHPRAVPDQPGIFTRLSAGEAGFEPSRIQRLNNRIGKPAFAQIEFAPDSPVEGDGFELPVPRERRYRDLTFCASSICLKLFGVSTRKRQQGEANMPAYFVVELEITNQAAMEPYRAAVGATITQYGGRFLTRGGTTELIEGRPEPKRIVILEFADTAAVKRWYNSPEYQKILPGRLDNSTSRAFIVEGAS
jgi:uncharacterized protein (DUF1330 family)